MHHRSTIFTFVVLLVILLQSGVFGAQTGLGIAVLVGGKPLELRTPARQIDGRIMVPIECLSALGAKSEPIKSKRDYQKLKITSSSEQVFTTQTRLADGELFLDIRVIAKELGIAAVWNEKSRILSLRSVIRRIEYNGSQLKIGASCPVSAAILDTNWTRKSQKLVLDLAGAQFPDDKSSLKIVNATDSPIDTGQSADGETARVVLNAPAASWQPLASRGKSSEIVVSRLESSVTPQPRPNQYSPYNPPTQDPSPIKPSNGYGRPMISVTGVDFQKQSSRQVEVEVTTSGPVSFSTSMTRQPHQLFLDISRAKLDAVIPDIILEHQILEQIHVEQKDSATVRIALDLKRIAGFATRWDEALGKFFITLELPKGAGGLLSQKIIVIDPGHGGKDQGAQGRGALEKDCNLPIALRVQKLLSQSGACAVLTRESDYYIPLTQRVDSATRHSADLFVSIHCNSCPVPDSISGIETYFHADDMNGRALAQSIHAEVLRASGLPDRRVRSDTTLHKTGLAVLRGTSAVGIPSTLVEVGFLNNSSDGFMIVSPEYQDDVAKAIVNGLKQYIEGSSD